MSYNIETVICQKRKIKRNRETLLIGAASGVLCFGASAAWTFRRGGSRFLLLACAGFVFLFGVILIYERFLAELMETLMEPAVPLVQLMWLMGAVFLERIILKDLHPPLYMAVLFPMAAVFYSIPILTCGLQLLSLLAYCAISRLLGNAGVMTLTFCGAIGVFLIVLCFFVIGQKNRLLRKEVRDELLWTYDPLSLMKNRRSYEAALKDFSAKESVSAGIILAEAVGLKTINEKEGYDAGNQMIRFVADQMRTAFGGENTFRTGSGSFAAVLMDYGIDEIREGLSRLESGCMKQNCQVLTGWAFESGTSVGFEIMKLVESARKDLEKSESEYYLNHGSIGETFNSIRMMSDIEKEDQTTAGVDPLTGLFTRENFYYAAQRSILFNADLAYCMAMVEIVSFKEVNDRYGSEFGDTILRRMGQALCSREARITAAGRYGSASFAALLSVEENESEDEVEERLFHAVRLSLKGEQFRDITLRYGFYHQIPKEVSVPSLCEQTAAAMQSVRHSDNKRSHRYEGEIRRKFEETEKIRGEIGKVIQTEQFRVFYQPKHDVKTMELVGAEALIRWYHPDHGYISPKDFIPVFEKNRLTLLADTFVWEHVCSDLSRWKRSGVPVIPISVNVSANTLRDDTFRTRIFRDIRYHDLKNTDLNFELSGSDAEDNLAVLGPLVSELREKGICVELDGFGGAQNSLQLLEALPVDGVKLDRSFVENIEDEKKRKILEGCVSLCRNLGCRTVVEGIETREQLLAAEQAGADQVQGYFFSEAVGVPAFEEYMLTKLKQDEKERGTSEEKEQRNTTGSEAGI